MSAHLNFSRRRNLSSVVKRMEKVFYEVIFLLYSILEKKAVPMGRGTCDPLLLLQVNLFNRSNDFQGETVISGRKTPFFGKESVFVW